MALNIDETRCVLCGLCVSECPAGAFRGEGEHMVGQSHVFESVTLDNEKCTGCGECTATQFWCPAEAIYDDSVSTTHTPFGTRLQVGRESDGQKYSRFLYRYKPGDDPRVDMVPADMPMVTITSFKDETFPISGAPWTWATWRFPHDEPLFEVGHPPHIHREPELLIFIGGDPVNPAELGAEVEFYMGAEMEKLVITESCVVYIPPNVIHAPWKPMRTEKPWFFMELHPGANHTEKGFHQLLPTEVWDSPELLVPMIADH